MPAYAHLVYRRYGAIKTMNYSTSLSSIGPQVLETSRGMYQLSAPVSLDDLLAITTSLLEDRFKRSDYMTSPTTTKNYLTAKLSARDREVFACIFLDSQHGVLSYEELFMGTINTTTIHVREVVKRALALNAAALILSHNHPSGLPEPSLADRQITKQLSDALGMMDIRVLDHIVIGGAESVSLAERGWM
jgi:DNA repair protein RadC